MPIYTRRELRQRLGRMYLRDMVLGQTSGSFGVTGSFAIVDSALADPTATGEQLYTRNWLRLVGSAGFIQDVRVGSWNHQTGAFAGAQALATTIISGNPFEVHALVSPTEKDLAIDEVMGELRYRQEVPIPSIPNSMLYSIGPEINRVLDVRFLSDPDGSLGKGEGAVTWWKLETTATGRELRINTSLQASQQLLIDAILTPTLGSGDLATVNLLNPTPLLWGATAKCIQLVELRAPSQEAGRYKERRLDAQSKYTRLSRRFAPKIAVKPQLDEWW